MSPVEEWLEAHRADWSPNTVRGYATALAQWWTFLEQRCEADAWDQVGVPSFNAFLSWLRNGRTTKTIPGESGEGPSAGTLEARLATLISFYRWHQAVNSVPVAERLLKGAPRRVASRGLLAHLDWRGGPAPSSLVRIRRTRRRDRPPLLLPQQVQAILDGCAVFDVTTGEWNGNLRDRFLFALLAETGLFSGGRPGRWRV
ncbi:site-specific integrase [Nonomuraea sp. NPDC000554]|uniref:site-specific integrase n=1 Tax=Nonomuraea sp. NPDC000554 TaxID=3154259 RepID=UPI0033257402